jgi:hypothetical protein
MKKLAGMITTDTYSTKSRTVQRHHLLCACALTSRSSSADIIINISSSIVRNSWWLTLDSTCRCRSHLAEEVP